MREITPRTTPFVWRLPPTGLASGLADGETASGREIPEPAIHKARVVPYSATDVRLMSRRIVSRVSRSQEWRASGHSHATRDRPDPRHGKYIKIKLMPVEPSRKVISPILVLAKKRSAQVGRKYRTDVSNQRGLPLPKPADLCRCCGAVGSGREPLPVRAPDGQFSKPLRGFRRVHRWRQGR